MIGRRRSAADDGALTLLAQLLVHKFISVLRAGCGFGAALAQSRRAAACAAARQSLELGAGKLDFLAGPVPRDSLVKIDGYLAGAGQYRADQRLVKQR